MLTPSVDRPLNEASSRPDSDTVRVGVIGYGYWGPNIVRNLHGQDQCDVVARRVTRARMRFAVRDACIRTFT